MLQQWRGKTSFQQAETSGRARIRVGGRLPPPVGIQSF